MKSLWQFVIVLLALVALASHASHELPPARATSDPPGTSSAAAPGSRPGTGPSMSMRDWETQPLPRQDLFDLVVGSRYAPRSDWIESEKKAFREIVTRDKAALLIAPFQVQSFGLDTSARSLMMAELSGAVAEAVPNAYAVQRAAGEGSRKLTEDELTSLAQAIGASKIISTSVGYERRDRLVVTATVWQRDPGDPQKWTSSTKSWSDAAFSDERPPAAAFRGLIPALLEFAAVAPKAVSSGDPKPAPKARSFPHDLAEATQQSKQGAISRSLVLQLLGTLAPAAPERPRERLFEQALLALDSDGPGKGSDDALADFLRARSLYYLHLRPAAIAALGTSKTPETVAFRQFLNGNLPDMQEAVAKVSDPVARLMLEVDLQDMRDAYYVGAKPKRNPFVASLIDKHPDWRPLVTRRLAEGDPWAVQDNVAIKLLLDRHFPVPGFDAASMARGSVTLGKGIDTGEVALAVFEHIRRARQADPSLYRCGGDPGACVKGAYLDVLEGVAISNAVRGLEKLARVQGLSEQAAASAEALAPVLSGQVDFLIARTAIIDSQAQARRDASRGVRSDMRDTQLRLAAAAAYFDRGQGLASAAALTTLDPDSSPGLPFVLGYNLDFPQRPEWTNVPRPMGAGAPEGGRPFTVSNALAYSNFAIRAAKGLIESKDPEQQAVGRSALSTRFRGHPDRNTLLAQFSDDVDTRMANFASAIKERPDFWANYMGLADLQIGLKNDYAAATRTFDSFPGFRKGAAYNEVDVSNYAYEAGSKFFWTDRLEQARRYYKIAAGLRTGSHASMTSDVRLEILDGNYPAAAQRSLERAQRYNSPYAYRDYLSWLFAMGYPHDAWAAFNQIHSSLENPQVWLAAYVGHRMERKSWPELRAWLLSEPIRSSGVNRQKFALTYAVMLNTMDRMPSPDLPDVLVEIEGDPVNVVDALVVNAVSVARKDVDSMSPVYRSPFRRADRPQLTPGTKVASQHVFFARGYVALRAGKFDDAVRHFDAMADYYPVEGQILSGVDTYALPYFAWAAAKTGDAPGLEKFLGTLPNETRGFDYYLALAFFTGLRGETATAVAHLESAFNNRPFTEHRPIFTEYQWAEACEWLYTATGEAKYRDMAIRGAKANQKVQPMYSWAYTMEASLTRSAADRNRALGFALHLDPLSERIARFSQADREKATKWYAANNPFKVENARRKASVVSEAPGGRADASRLDAQAPPISVISTRRST